MKTMSIEQMENVMAGNVWDDVCNIATAATGLGFAGRALGLKFTPVGKWVFAAVAITAAVCIVAN